MDERFTVLEAMMDKIVKQSSDKKEKGMGTTEKSIDQKVFLMRTGVQGRQHRKRGDTTT